MPRTRGEPGVCVWVAMPPFPAGSMIARGPSSELYSFRANIRSKFKNSTPQLMRTNFLLALPLILAFAGRPARPPQAAKPLTQNQVMELVKAGMDSSVLAEKVKQLGIDFTLTEDYLQALRKAGAKDVLIEMLRSLRPKPLTREQVLELVAGGVPSERAADLVKRHGIDFVPNQVDLETFRVAGAEEVLLAALREAGNSVTAPGAIKLNSKDGLKYVWIPPGTFQMGCSPGDNDCRSDEMPAHPVTLTRGFWLGQFPVTMAAYKRFAESTGRTMPPAPRFNEGWNLEQMPVVNVTWDDAHAYCGWVGGRLPTEAEWEYAARGGSKEMRYGPLDEVAWHDSNSGYRTHVGGEKRANGFALFDMLGNVDEWVNDWYDADYYVNSPSMDPLGPPKGAERILRGGCWYNYPRFVRVSARYGSGSSGKDFNGLRCAMDAGSR